MSKFCNIKFLIENDPFSENPFVLVALSVPKDQYHGDCTHPNNQLRNFDKKSLTKEEKEKGDLHGSNSCFGELCLVFHVGLNQYHDQQYHHALCVRCDVCLNQ